MTSGWSRGYSRVLIGIETTALSTAYHICMHDYCLLLSHFRCHHDVDVGLGLVLGFGFIGWNRMYIHPIEVYIH